MVLTFCFSARVTTRKVTAMKVMTERRMSVMTRATPLSARLTTDHWLLIRFVFILSPALLPQFARPLPPRPCPLPWGERERQSGFRQTGAHQVFQDLEQGSPSPQGRGQG